MVKLRTEPTKMSDLIEYLEKKSDFAFELGVLKKLRDLGIDCRHGGSYEDPTTKKWREFDIRATLFTDKNIALYVAIECKNIGENYPLLVSTVPRKVGESALSLIVPNPRTRYDPLLPTVEVIDADWRTTRYPIGDPIGKSCVQVGRSDGKDNELHAEDKGIYEKWAQALASAHDLVDEAIKAAQKHQISSIVLACLVVPDGRLWRVDFADDGSRLGDPKAVHDCSFFVGYSVNTKDGLSRMRYQISHVEILTVSGLLALLSDGADSFLGALRKKLGAQRATRVTRRRQLHARSASRETFALANLR
jgi:hypothetical protein